MYNGFPLLYDNISTKLSQNEKKMAAQTALREATGQLKLQQACQRYYSTSISEHIDTFIQISYIAQ